jgi:hypothetical protein
MTMRRIIALAAVASLGAAAGGCSGPPRITMGEAVLPEDEGSPGFLDRVASLEVVSENDAMRGMLLLMDGQDPATEFSQRVGMLIEREVVPSIWDFQANRPLTKGRLAYMVHQACDAPEGLILAVAGPSERYCLRELQYRGMMSQGFVTTQVSGMEFVAVLTRADSYRRTGALPEVISGRRRE